jgi:hypothetical protein
MIKIIMASNFCDDLTAQFLPLVACFNEFAIWSSVPRIASVPKRHENAFAFNRLNRRNVIAIAGE